MTEFQTILTVDFIMNKIDDQSSAEARNREPVCTAPAGRLSERYLITLMVLTGILMSVVDGSVVSIALPTITRYFQVDVARSQWVITGYLVSMTSLLLVFGRISELTGKMRLFISGMALFTASSLACGLSSSLDQLIIFRISQAIGAAMMFSISSAIIFQTFPKEEKGRAMGYVGSTAAVGSILGPIIGGIIVDFLGWNYIFLINVPIGAAIMILSLRFLRAPEARCRRLNMDWMGAGMLIIFMISLMLFLGQLAENLGLTSPSAISGAIFLIALLAFLKNESKHRAPLLDLSIFKIKNFVLPVIGMIAFIISNFMIMITGPFYLEGVLGYSPSRVGLVFLIVPAITVFGSPLAGWLYDRYHWRYYSALGMALMAAVMISMGFMSRRIDQTIDQTLILLSLIPLGIGSALFQSPNNTEIMKSLPCEKLGTASSVRATVVCLGMALGVSISSILVSVQLSWAGLKGPMIDVGPGMLTVMISNIIIISGLLCLAGTVVLLPRSPNC